MNFRNLLLKTKLLLLLIFGAGLIARDLHAQVTTSSLAGSVRDAQEAMAGASVLAVHEPSGTRYGTSVSSNGTFSINNMRVGGPYKVTISFIGYSSKVYNDIVLRLGETYILHAVMEVEEIGLTHLVVIGSAGVDADKTGVSMHISNRQIQAIPTISRSITDMTRLTPQSNGNSFAGRDGRYNNVQIDGANFNNGFGLNDDPLPGGGGLSLDAIEEIQVNIAPFDVRQGGFTGAGINAVTRSGTNQFVGSAYHFFRNEGMIGKKVKGEEIGNLEESSTKTWGFRLGGPLIKDKLFFFVNAEQINAAGPEAGAVNLWRASEDGTSDAERNITRVKRSDLEAVRNHLIDQWGYDPGAYEGYANGKSSTKSVLARIDWNISKNHKLAVRFNSTDSEQPVLVNNASGARPRSPEGPYSRVGENSMAFAKTMYNNASRVQSFAAELNSSFGSRVSNQFLATYSKIRSGRTSPSEEFPFIDIGDGLGSISTGTYFNYISAGYELFTYNNQVLNDNYNIFNNTSLSLGRHNILVGASFELQKFANNYMRNGTSYYRYATVEDFLKTGTPQEGAPIQFALTYPYEGQEPWARVDYALPALYVQDNFNVNDLLSLTFGLRAEVPMFLNKLVANTNVDALDLLDPYGNVRSYRTGEWPKQRIMLSPRVGFRYDVMGDRSLIIRGGAGIFAGRVPFVWLTNMPANTGMIQNQIEPGSYGEVAGWINDIRFNPDKLYWFDNTPASAQNVFLRNSTGGIPGALAMVDNNFRMPQILRASLGVEKRLGGSPFTLVADALYTKDIQAVYQFGPNRKESSVYMSDGREYYASSDAFTYNSAIGGNSGMVLTNTTLGNSFNLSAGVRMAPRSGVFGSLFYSYTHALTTTDNSGSSASSAWGATPQRSNPNDLFLAPGIEALPHRVVGNISVRKEYFKHLATTLSLYYNGVNQGIYGDAVRGRYSFVYGGDVNGDNIGNDLIYIPDDASEINFVADGNFSVEDQVTAFNKLMENSDYLRKNKGKIADRNGAVMPWYHRFDFRLLQDLMTDIGKSKNSLQLSVDIMNVGNLLNSGWGIMKQVVNNAATPLTVVSKGENPTFRMNTANIDGKTVLPTGMYQDARTFGTTWTMQVGIRYNFN